MLAQGLSLEHWRAQPKSSVNQDIWRPVDKISISGNQVICEPLSRYFCVTDRPHHNNLYKRKKTAYHASSQPKAQKSLGSHNFQLITHPSPTHTPHQPHMIQRAKLAGDFSLALLCGCLKTGLKVSSRLDNRQALCPPLGLSDLRIPLNPLVSQLVSLWQM